MATFLMGVAILLSMGAATCMGLWMREKDYGAAFIRKVGALNRRALPPDLELRLRRRLVQAGDPRGQRPEDILGFQEMGLRVGLLLGMVAASGVGASLAWSLPVALLGASVPLLWLEDQVKKRQLQIARALPWTLDLLTLSVEAGLDFTAALSKVVEKGRAGPLRDELHRVLNQLKMGKTREEALKNMAARVGLPPLTSFVHALVQADRMGTRLGAVLRNQSTWLRNERTQRAEKRASEAPVKLLFPLVVFIFPTVFMILFGPLLFAVMFENALG
jgi:tight adherence protein C